MNSEQRNRKTIDEEFDRVFLHHAIEDYLETSDEYEQALREALSEPTYHFSQEHEAKMEQLFASLGQTQPAHKSRKWMGKLALAASFIMVTSGGALLVTNASIEDILNFFIQRNPSHTEIILSQDYAERYRQAFESADWDAHYPTYLPRHYALQDINMSKNSCYLTYEKGDVYLRIFQYPTGSNRDLLFHIDTENAKLSYVTINGIEAECIEKGTHRTIQYTGEGVYFIVTSNGLSKSQLLKVAKSLESSEVKK